MNMRWLFFPFIVFASTLQAFSEESRSFLKEHLKKFEFFDDFLFAIKDEGVLSHFIENRFEDPDKSYQMIESYNAIPDVLRKGVATLLVFNDISPVLSGRAFYVEQMKRNELVIWVFSRQLPLLLENPTIDDGRILCVTYPFEQGYLLELSYNEDFVNCYDK